MLRPRTRAGTASSLVMSRSASGWLQIVAMIQTLLGASPRSHEPIIRRCSQRSIGSTCSGPRCSSASSSRLRQFPMRFDSSSQSSSGVRRTRSSRSTSHSIGTSLSSQSASEAQKTRARASFRSGCWHCGQQSTTPGSGSKPAGFSLTGASRVSPRQPQPMHSPNGCLFHRSGSPQVFVRCRGWPAPHCTRCSRLSSRRSA